MITLVKTSAIIYFLTSGATFTWLVRDSSSLQACTADVGGCEALLQFAGPPAIVWPVYWAGTFFGRPDLAISLSNTLFPFLLLLIFGIVVFRGPTRKRARQKGKATRHAPEETEPTAWFVSPNRRNQSLNPRFD